jgi:hypothetical protein
MDQPEPTPGKDPETGQFLPGHKVTSAFKPEYVAQAKMLCERFGAIDSDLAEFFGVSVRSIHRWKHDFPEFREALTVGKEVADDRVEQSLYARAIGYSHDAVKIMAVEGKVIEVPYVEHFPPDTPAARLWLMNRRGWSDKTKVEANVGLTVNIAGADADL